MGIAEKTAQIIARAWQQALDAHANAVFARAIEAENSGPIVMADDPGGRPTVEILGPDGVWRRYFVRLTEASKPLPFDPADLQAMRS